MRRLMLLRHAKASPQGASDLERPLAPRGEEAAPLMARYLGDEGLLPDLALVSPALRTRQTWDLVAPELANTPMRLEERIYEAPSGRLLEAIGEVEAEVRGLLLIGHNPGMEGLARTLIGHGDRYAFARLAQKYPTLGLAVIDFDTETWSQITPRSGRLDRFVTPKTIGAGEDD